MAIGWFQIIRQVVARLGSKVGPDCQRLQQEKCLDIATGVLEEERRALLAELLWGPGPPLLEIMPPGGEKCLDLKILKKDLFGKNMLQKNGWKICLDWSLGC